MNEIKQSTPTENEVSERIAFWGTIGLSVILLSASIYFVFFLLQQARTLINYIGAAIFVVAIAISIASIVLSIRKQQLLGTQLIFFFLNIFGITMSGLFQGRALSGSLTILIISALIIWRLFPSQLKRSHSIIAAIGFALIWVIEWFNPAWRIPLVAPEAGPGAIVAFIVILGILAFFQFRRRAASSLRLQITAWTASIITVLSIIIISYSVYTSRQTAISTAQAEALSVAEAHAGIVKGDIEPALDTARTMADSLEIIKDPANPVSLTRSQVNAILKKQEEENPTFLGTWTLWEPNAFDGLDAQYANTPMHDSTGRFIPYWVRSGADNNTIEGVAIVDYETPKPGVNDWYFIPRDTLNETLSAPYVYPINGVNVLMTTLSVPIVNNDKFYGVAGVDLKIDFVQNILDDIDLYNGKAAAVLLTDTGTVVAVGHQPKQTLQPATTLYKDFNSLQPRIAAGEAFISLSPDGQDLRVFSPIEVGNVASHWSLSLIIPFSEITAAATTSALREVVISIVMILLALLVLWYLTGQIVRPIRELTAAANSISEGNLDVVANVTSSNETGILAKAFNSMTAQLRGTLSTLEQRVAERTRNLELSAKVGRTVSQVRALDVLLKDATEIIRSEFDLYYVQVYLVNPSGTYLELQSGTGHVGEQLVARNHRLPLGTGSINGRAAVDKKSVVISDTTNSPTFKPNPLLPETRSEMTVPLLFGDQVVGVLDMQSKIAGSLSHDALPAFEALAGQLAVAVQNANLLAETQQARTQVEEQIRRLARTNWREYLDAIHTPEHAGYVFDGKAVTPLTAASDLQTSTESEPISASIQVDGESVGSLIVESETEKNSELVNVVARQVAQQIESLRLLESAERYRMEAEEAARLTTVEGWKKYVEERPANALGFMYDTNEVKALAQELADPALVLPIKVGDEAVGKLAVHELETTDEQSLEIAKSVIETLGAHIENLRLLEETKQSQLELNKRAAELQSVAEIATQSSQATNLDEMLQTVVDLTKSSYSLYHAHIYLLDDVSGKLALTAGAGEVGRQMVSQKRSIDLEHPHSLVARAARTNAGAISNDVSKEPDFLPNPLLPDTKAEMAIPIAIGATLIGVLDVQANTVNRFTDEDIAIKTTLSRQIAVALENLRNLKQSKQLADNLSEALDIARLGNWEYDVEKDLFTFNDNFYSVFHTSVKEVGSYTMPSSEYAMRFVHPEDAPLVGGEIGKALNSTEQHYTTSLEHRVIFSDGAIGYIAVNVHVERDEQGKIVRFYGANQDITERKQAEEALRARETQLSAALTQTEKLSNAGFRFTQAADLQELMAAAIEMLGIPQVNRAILNVFNYDESGNIESLDVIANWWNGTGYQATEAGTHYSRETVRAMSMFISPTPVFFNDTLNDERVDETTMQLVKRLNLRAVAVLPLHTTNGQLGALILEAEEPHTFTTEETRLFVAIAPQIATIVDNRRQFERAQQQAKREAMLNTISQKIQSATSVEAVLQIAARELGHALGAPMTVAQLSMKDKSS